MKRLNKKVTASESNVKELKKLIKQLLQLLLALLNDEDDDDEDYEVIFVNSNKLQDIFRSLNTGNVDTIIDQIKEVKDDIINNTDIDSSDSNKIEEIVNEIEENSSDEYEEYWEYLTKEGRDQYYAADFSSDWYIRYFGDFESLQSYLADSFRQELENDPNQKVVTEDNIEEYYEKINNASTCSELEDIASDICYRNRYHDYTFECGTIDGPGDLEWLERQYDYYRED